MVNNKYQLLVSFDKKIVESVPDFNLTTGSVFIDETTKVNPLITLKIRSIINGIVVNK